VRQTPDELLEFAVSANCRHRCDAAEQLVDYEDDRAARALLGLLTDEQDTAPIQAAAEALIRRRDERGAELIFRAITLGDDDAADHLLYFTAGGAELGHHVIWAMAERSARSPDDATRKGALELLRYVGHPTVAECGE
jgi:hypothetical protein